MESRDSVVLLFEETVNNSRGMFPGVDSIKGKLIEIKKETLKQNLRDFLIDVEDIFSDLPTLSSGAKLTQVTVSVQINAEGGLNWIASAKTGMTNTMSLTFTFKNSHEAKDGN